MHVFVLGPCEQVRQHGGQHRPTARRGADGAPAGLAVASPCPSPPRRPREPGGALTGSRRLLALPPRPSRFAPRRQMLGGSHTHLSTHLSMALRTRRHPPLVRPVGSSGAPLCRVCCHGPGAEGEPGEPFPGRTWAFLSESDRAPRPLGPSSLPRPAQGLGARAPVSLFLSQFRPPSPVGRARPRP